MSRVEGFDASRSSFHAMVDDSWYLKRPHLQQDLILIIIILSPYCYRLEALNYEACVATAYEPRLCRPESPGVWGGLKNRAGLGLES